MAEEKREEGDEPTRFTVKVSDMDERMVLRTTAVLPCCDP